MKMQKCSICGSEKPATTEFYYRRSKHGELRKDCITCSKDKTRPRRKITKWYYENTKQLFLDNGLKPLFDKFDGRVKAKEKLPAVNDEGYKVVVSIDKLKANKKPDSFSKFNPYTIENIKEYLIRNADGYSILSKDFKNNYSKLKWKCGADHEFEMSWGDFQQGKRCAKCSGRYQRTNDEFKQEVYKLVGREYTFLEEFKTVDDRIKIIHNECGHVYKVSPYKFINRGHRCPNCNKYKPVSDEDFKKRVYELVGDEYTFLAEYEKAIVKMSVKHNECGYIYEVSPHKFINHERRCPRCNESKGEKKISTYLDKHEIKYIPQYSFDDCANELPLRFDFAIFNKRRHLELLIEFDGRQHFKPIDYFGGEEGFKRLKINDTIKNNYCKDNNIKLLRIPYTEYDNIEKILATHLL